MTYSSSDEMEKMFQIEGMPDDTNDTLRFTIAPDDYNGHVVSVDVSELLSFDCETGRVECRINPEIRHLDGMIQRGRSSFTPDHPLNEFRLQRRMTDIPRSIRPCPDFYTIDRVENSEDSYCSSGEENE